MQHKDQDLELVISLDMKNHICSPVLKMHLRRFRSSHIIICKYNAQI